jgi:Flp pilus assembly protein TadG
MFMIRRRMISPATSQGQAMLRFIAAPKPLATFWNQQRGSVAILFALTVFVLCGSIALGLDYARALALRTKLQSAVDAAALSAHPDGTNNDPTMAARVTTNFDYNMQNQKYGVVNLNVTSTPIAQGIHVDATAQVPTTFGRLLGINTMAVSVAAEAISANATYEIALVLDNTGSMDGSKINSLKTAAKSLVDTIEQSGAANAVKFCLVPFSNYVNVGLANRKSMWMSVPADYTESGNGCYTTTDWDGCPMSTQTGTCSNDGVPYSCSWSYCTTPGPPRQICSSWTYTHTWNGCAGSRKPAPDLEVTASFASPIPGILDVGCPSELTRLTNDSAVIKAQIDGMIASGETYIASGLMWGWRVLSPGPPFADGQPPNANPPNRKVMIVMTDGANTKSQQDTGHEGSDQNAADAAMVSLCTAIKAQNIELYTIAFTITDPMIKARLQGCATDPGHFFDSADGAALEQAFSQISGSLIKLSLSR